MFYFLCIHVHSKNCLRLSDTSSLNKECKGKFIDLGFLNMQGNTVFTPNYAFKANNNPNVLKDANGTIVQLFRYGQYIELPNRGLQCIQDMTSCDNGFYLGFDIKFHRFNPISKTYIIESGGDVINSTGLSIFLQYQYRVLHLICSAKRNQEIWTSKRLIQATVKRWYSLEISWNDQSGFEVYLDGQFFMNTSKHYLTPTQPVMYQMLIGRTVNDSVPTSLLDIRNLYVWTESKQRLVRRGCLVQRRYKSVKLPGYKLASYNITKC